MIETIYEEYNTKIINGYLIPNRLIKEKVTNIIYNRIEQDLLTTRSTKSYIGEIRIHKILYKLGLFRNKTNYIRYQGKIRTVAFIEEIEDDSND